MNMDLVALATPLGIVLVVVVLMLRFVGRVQASNERIAEQYAKSAIAVATAMTKMAERLARLEQTKGCGADV